ncbi:hypothetical protein [Niabella hibiscisoli]|uniref:hypothetical protein n=1 Tax=Niabella hibiscisoli TaxID=1825928 RepID=UPI001F0D55E4|nr:hypothetical protein [Niabella hibiscisoli]MCH5717377.1 hypothetical protein [Niabella hibiscisoli]
MMTSKKIIYVILTLLLAGAFLFLRNKPEAHSDDLASDGIISGIDSLTREDVVVPYVKNSSSCLCII